MLRRELWQQLGMHPEDLDLMPWREAEEFITYLELSKRQEQAPAGAGGAVSGR